MFVRFTRKDGGAVWINSRYIVTVEQAKAGGSIVVPLGDGVDYEVRESPADAIGLIERARAEKSPDAAVGGFEPAAPSGSIAQDAPVPAEPVHSVEEAPPAPVFESAPGGEGLDEKTSANGVAAFEAFVESKTRAPAKKPGARRTRKAPAKKTQDGPAADVPESAAAPDPAPADEQDAPDVFAAGFDSGVKRRRDSAKAQMDLTNDEIDRLRAMAPKTVKKIVNSLNAQFGVQDADETVRSLSDRGIIAIDDKGRVAWPAAKSGGLAGADD